MDIAFRPTDTPPSHTRKDRDPDAIRRTAVEAMGGQKGLSTWNNDSGVTEQLPPPERKSGFCVSPTPPPNTYTEDPFPRIQ